MTWATLGLASAEELVWMGRHPRANSQLEGAVAIHNVLQRERIAYLADEVGLGKTYVALATLALFRHYDPGMRVLIIAPRSNIQTKWMNEWRSFVRTNWRISDLRVKGASGAPARRLSKAERLSDLAFDSTIDARADVFARLTSFSFAVAGDRAVVKQRVRRSLPWLEDGDFPRDDDRFRDFVAQAYNAVLPAYDLVIIDEAHNLKHGVRIRDGLVQSGALRNTTLAQVLGHPDVTPHPVFAGSYRPLADRVLLLSATPVEESFSNLWNQVHLVGKSRPPQGQPFDDLRSSVEAEASACASRILVRRINSLTVNGQQLTKSGYRRTWYQGGVGQHDEPLGQGTLRQRLSVALVQKKVSDLIGTRFNNSFQMGMLASFESFAETALKPRDAANGTDPEEDGAAVAVFDGDQSYEASERVGIDTNAVNALARDHFETFGRELAHPKMDELVADLSRSWETGTKTLVFVRRVASVTEIKRKLDESYDTWLFERLEAELPGPVWQHVRAARAAYGDRRVTEGRALVGPAEGGSDAGGADTFFAWYFRGEGPMIDGTDGTDGRGEPESGASLARRLRMDSGAASTFFAPHYLADLLGCVPASTVEAVAEALGRSVAEVEADLEERARHYLPISAGRRRQFDAVQAAGIELLARDLPDKSRLRETAKVLRDELQQVAGERRTLTFSVRDQLATPTFYTQLRHLPDLQRVLLPTAESETRDKTWAREHYLRAVALGSATRLGLPLIDLYVACMKLIGIRPLTANDDVDRMIDPFLAVLDRQRLDGVAGRAYAELAAIAGEFPLIRSQNLPATEQEMFVLASAGTECGTLLGSQQPTAGMAGRVNRTAVRQFRMPGYPYVLVCTDVLQEGEDLHTFCDRVVHYGVAWTASAMEQRTGRVDRLNSLAERRFAELDSAGRDLTGPNKIQVQLPYLGETVERLQARTVLKRMHDFTTLMHKSEHEGEERRLDVDAEMLRPDWSPPETCAPMVSAFDVKVGDLRGRARGPRVSDETVAQWWQRLVRLRDAAGTRELFVDAVFDDERLAVYSSRALTSRVQPFSLHLVSQDSMAVVSARTPVARRVDLGDDDTVTAELAGVLDRVILAEHNSDREYDVSIAGDVLLVDPESDAARVRWLVDRITARADQVEERLTDHDLQLDDVQATLRKDSGL